MPRSSSQPEDGERCRVKLMQRKLNQIVQSRKMRIIDIGCGNGVLTREICTDHEVYGVDINSNALSAAVEHGIKTHIVNVGCSPLPFPSESFDVAVMGSLLEYILDPDHLLNEVNRVLTKNGFLLLSFPNVAQPVSFIMLAKDLPPRHSARWGVPDVKDYTLRIAKRILGDHGFIVQNAYGTYIHPSTSKLSQFLAERFPRLGSDIVVVAKKAHNVKISMKRIPNSRVI